MLMQQQQQQHRRRRRRTRSDTWRTEMRCAFPGLEPFRTLLQYDNDKPSYEVLCQASQLIGFRSAWVVWWPTYIWPESAQWLRLLILSLKVQWLVAV